ncbi:hypothetical protein GQ600_14951 [Phytophthora cactorum]|nr:hypothetical protein GQ600_14951 [Phytophthora cactorum]
MPSQEPSLLPRQEQRYVGQNVILHRGDMANTDGWVEDTFVEITYDLATTNNALVVTSNMQNSFPCFGSTDVPIKHDAETLCTTTMPCRSRISVQVKTTPYLRLEHCGKAYLIYTLAQTFCHTSDMIFILIFNVLVFTFVVMVAVGQHPLEFNIFSELDGLNTAYN